jgi:phage/plasmid-associated DNA primase
VLNSSEVSDTDGFNKAVKFVSGQFKSMTGGDAIYARELGTKNTTHFTAGKVLIQTNNMPVFSKIDTSLRERIVVMNFPYTYTDDETLLNKDPSKYKLKDVTLKAKFASDLYRIAMINILFKNYKEYKKSFIIPESVKTYTQSYFAGQSIKSWIDENCDEKAKGNIELETLKQMYNNDTGKNMSVKQIKDELTELEYILKRGNNSGFNLKGFVFKNVEQEEC